MLPNEVLLSIFYFGAYSHKTFAVTVTGKEAWQSLAHVCQQWQRVIFGSPRCLDLQLFCAPGTHRDNVNVWPPLPLIILDRDCHTKGLDNIVALLEYSDRVREINLGNISSLHYFEKVLAATRYSEAIPTADKSDALVTPLSSSSQDASRSRLVPGCICPTSARTFVGTVSVSGLTETTFVCYYCTISTGCSQGVTRDGL